MTIFLTECQENAFARIAALPGCNSYGGPGWRQLEATLALAERDRAPVLRAFADEVHVRMSVDERFAVERGITNWLAREANSSHRQPAIECTSGRS